MCAKDRAPPGAAIARVAASRASSAAVRSLAAFAACAFTASLAFFGASLAAPAQAAELADTIAAVKPSVVAIATYQKTRSPAAVFFGTGFVVGDGLTIVTNAHVVTPQLDAAKSGMLGVLAGNGDATQFRPATLAALDAEHDLAVLKITGTALPALHIGDSTKVREGQSVAFTGFPLGMALGFHRVTHRAMVSAITPVVQPAMNSRGLDARAIVQLQKSAYGVFQLDGTAYPGNSGSPVFDPATGEVLGIVNLVFVKGLKETAITAPSGITYAIQGQYLRQLLRSKELNQ